MPEDYYQDPGAEAGAGAAPDGAKPENEEKAEGETALLPKSILAGKNFEPGEEVVLKVVHVYEDEVEVEYAKEPGKGESEMAKADGKLALMGGPGAGGEE